MSDFTKKVSKEEFIEKAKDNGFIVDEQTENAFGQLYDAGEKTDELDSELNRVMTEDVWYIEDRNSTMYGFYTNIQNSISRGALSKEHGNILAGASNKDQELLDKAYQNRFNKERPITSMAEKREIANKEFAEKRRLEEEKRKEEERLAAERKKREELEAAERKKKEELEAAEREKEEKRRAEEARKREKEKKAREAAEKKIREERQKEFDLKHKDLNLDSFQKKAKENGWDKNGNNFTKTDSLAMKNLFNAARSSNNPKLEKLLDKVMTTSVLFYDDRLALGKEIKEVVKDVLENENNDSTVRIHLNYVSKSFSPELTKKEINYIDKKRDEAKHNTYDLTKSIQDSLKKCGFPDLDGYNFSKKIAELYQSTRTGNTSPLDEAFLKLFDTKINKKMPTVSQNNALREFQKDINKVKADEYLLKKVNENINDIFRKTEKRERLETRDLEIRSIKNSFDIKPAPGNAGNNAAKVMEPAPKSGEAVANKILDAYSKEEKRRQELENKRLQKIQKEYDAEETIRNTPKDKRKEDFDTYCALHTGSMAGNTPEKRKDNLAKVIAASALKKLNRPFSLTEIHKVTDSVKKNCAIDSLTDEQVTEALHTRKAVVSFTQARREQLYNIEPQNYEAYIKDMKSLADAMVSSKGHSTNYKKFETAVKAAAALEETTKNMNAEEKADAFRNANMDLISAVDKYTSGKEKVRTFDEGKKSFSNNMDALSIVSKYTAKKENQVLNDRVSEILGRINGVRKNKSPIDVNTFETSFGADNAQRNRIVPKKSASNADIKGPRVNTKML